MKILFFGDTRGNVGPNNVNKSMMPHLTERFTWAQRRNKYLQGMELLAKMFFSKVVVVSGISRKSTLLVAVAGVFHKKSVYIMHGCGRYERMLNGLPQTGKGLAYEAYLLEHADLLLPVSEKFMEWVKREYPNYADKTCFLYNGIDTSIPAEYRTAEKKPGSIAVSGGSTLLKNNLVVAQTVQSMDKSISLEIFGYVKTAFFPEDERITVVGKLDHEGFLNRLSQVEVFVLNSVFESFSLATVEALLCGCSVLISECAGIAGLLELEESDLIHDPMDQDEIRRKIEHLLENPNNERILAKFNLEEYTYPKTVERLERICGELANRKG